MSRITKEQAITEVGQRAVNGVQSESVDFTNRVTDGTAWSGFTEFSAHVPAIDAAGLECRLSMYVYIDSDDLKDCDDLSNLDWDGAIEDAEYSID